MVEPALTVSLSYAVVPVSFVSTTGVAPVTVTVSCTADTPSCVLALALNPTVTRMSVFRTVLNPVSSNFTL